MSVQELKTQLISGKSSTVQWYVLILFFNTTQYFLTLWYISMEPKYPVITKQTLNKGKSKDDLMNLDLVLWNRDVEIPGF